MITKLKPNEIFVFGSNIAGRHGKGAALQAMRFGAIYGQGFGQQGSTFAIPTKDAKLKTLPLIFIKVYVQLFVSYAMFAPEYKFLVTEIGCGLAGYSPKDIGPMFSEAKEVTNIILPKSFK